MDRIGILSTAVSFSLVSRKAASRFRSKMEGHFLHLKIQFPRTLIFDLSLGHIRQHGGARDSAQVYQTKNPGLELQPYPKSSSRYLSINQRIPRAHLSKLGEDIC